MSTSSKGYLIARLLLGLGFFMSGLGGLLNLMPPPELPDAGGAFMSALVETGYLMPLVKGVELVAGVMLLTGRFVPLALLILAPVLVNIVAFHLFLAPAGLPPGIVLGSLALFLAACNRDVWMSVLAAKPTSTADA
jgi:uncharacterized membrane protein YphA (DoxX/SURF4 family)